MLIKYVHHADIDKDKWDRCIDNAMNGLIYGYSYYLDIMSKNWDALVMNDYEAVMPLTRNKKFGISYLRQPVFTQQLGIFAPAFVESDITNAFMKKVLEEFSFAEINWNYANSCSHATGMRVNNILLLDRSFNDIQKNFKSDFVKKIKSNDLIYEIGEDVEEVISLFIKYYSKRIHVSTEDYQNLFRLYLLLNKKEQLFIRKVSSQDGQLLSIAIFLRDSRRIYYVLSVTLPEGRKEQSNYFLLYHAIKEYSNQNLIFDFEGSDIPSIQLFFKKFGGLEQPFPFVRINRLPFFLSVVKRVYDYFKFGKEEERL
ncbi:MAG: GNAT family N-acetyltransferase [Ginsengibacter sp.]